MRYHCEAAIIARANINRILHFLIDGWSISRQADSVQLIGSYMMIVGSWSISTDQPTSRFSGTDIGS